MGIVGGVAVARSSTGSQTPKCVPAAPGSATLIAQDACQQAFDVFSSSRRSSASRSPAATRRSGRAARSAASATFPSAFARMRSTGSFPNVEQRADARSARPARSAHACRRRASWFGAADGGRRDRPVQGLSARRHQRLAASMRWSARRTSRTIHDGRRLASTRQSNFKFGYGARIGLLQESIVVPGVSFTLHQARSADDRRRRQRLATSVNEQLDIDEHRREDDGVAHRREQEPHRVFGVAAGVGQDTYDSRATLTGTVERSSVAVGEPVARRSTQIARRARTSSPISRSTCRCSRSSPKSATVSGGIGRDVQLVLRRTRRPTRGSTARSGLRLSW